MGKVRKVVLLTVLCLWSQISVAVDAGSLINGKFDANFRKVRVEIARDLLTQVDRLANFVPSPRPSDLSWVEAERAAIDKLGTSDASNARLVQFYESPEFQNVKLYNVLQETKSAIACVIESNVPIRREMYCWSVASLYLGDRATLSDGVETLHRAKRLPEDTAKGGFALLLGAFSRGMHEYVVIPYLRGDIR